MPSLGEMPTQSSGVLSVNSLTTKILNKIPLCVIEFDLKLQYQPVRVKTGNTVARTKCKVLPLSLRIGSGGIPIAEGLTSLSFYTELNSTMSIQIPVRFTPDALSFLEGQRNDDLTIQFGLELSYIEYDEGGQIISWSKITPFSHSSKSSRRKIGSHC